MNYVLMMYLRFLCVGFQSEQEAGSLLQDVEELLKIIGSIHRAMKRKKSRIHDETMSLPV